MAVFEVQTRITRKHLMRKSKDELATWVLDEMDRNDALRARIAELEAERGRLRALLAEVVEWADRHGKEPWWLEQARAALAGKQQQEGE